MGDYGIRSVITQPVVKQLVMTSVQERFKQLPIRCVLSDKIRRDNIRGGNIYVARSVRALRVGTITGISPLSYHRGVQMTPRVNPESPFLLIHR